VTFCAQAVVELLAGCKGLGVGFMGFSREEAALLEKVSSHFGLMYRRLLGLREKE
jgi:hypothetical protein